MSDQNLESFLARLSGDLRDRKIADPRLLEEVRDHLADAVEAGLAEGLSIPAAEQRAIERFGTSHALAGDVRRAGRRPPALMLGAILAVAGTAAALAVQGGRWPDVHPLGTQNLLVFLAAGVLLNLTPGQDTIYILTRSISQGRRAGVLSVLGITSGSVVHTLAAAFGLSAILATSARVFAAMRVLGAAYLVYLGLRMLLRRPPRDERIDDLAGEDAWSIYRAGFLTNLLNPKVALFFLAFLPQFVSPLAGSRIGAFLFLGGLFITTGTIWCLVLAWSGAAMSARLRRPGTRSTLQRVTGIVFVGTGIKLAATR